MLTNLSLTDLIALRDHCYQESLGFKASSTDEENLIRIMEGKGCKMESKEYAKWHDRFKLCDKELSERVEKIFENNG
jgi:hypothetical protein